MFDTTSDRYLLTMDSFSLFLKFLEAQRLYSPFLALQVVLTCFLVYPQSESDPRSFMSDLG